MIIGLQSCRDEKLNDTSNYLQFRATNLSIGNGNLTASNGRGAIVTTNWTTVVIVNGNATTYSGVSKSNELPVMAGNEIEVKFTPSCPEQTEAYFTMPDGSTHRATASERSFTWTVPAEFTSGMQIKGESHYEADDFIYTEKGTITLIAIE